MKHRTWCSVESICLSTELDILSRRFPYKISTWVSKKLSQTRVAAKAMHQQPKQKAGRIRGDRGAPLKLETDGTDSNAERMLQCLLQQSCPLQLGREGNIANGDNRRSYNNWWGKYRTVQRHLSLSLSLKVFKLKSITGIANNGLISKTFVWRPVRPNEELRVWRQVCETQFCSLQAFTSKDSCQSRRQFLHCIKCPFLKWQLTQPCLHITIAC